MSKTIIPSDKNQERRMANPGKNNVFVGSRQGGPMEHSRTKQMSMKHKNPEFFKRQSDRRMVDSNMHPPRKDQDAFQAKQFAKGTMY